MSDVATAAEAEIAGSDAPAISPSAAAPETPTNNPADEIIDLDALQDDAPEETEPAAAGEPEPEPEPVELVEFDIGGTKIEVPKGAIPADVAEKIAAWTKAAQRGHTQRSQEVAEARKAADADRQEAAAFRKASGDLQNLYAHGLSVKQHIEQLEQAAARSDLWQTDPNGARQVSDTLAMKRQELTAIASRLQAGEVALEHAEREQSEQRARQSQEAMEKAKAEGREIVRKAVPNFDAKAEADLISYAVGLGISEDAARDWALNPITAILAHKARMYDRAQAAASAVPKKAAVPVTAPAAAGGAVPNDPANMSPGQVADMLRKRGIIR